MNRTTIVLFCLASQVAAAEEVLELFKPCEELVLAQEVTPGASTYPAQPFRIDRRPASIRNMHNGEEWNTKHLLNNAEDVDPADGVPDGFNRLLEGLDESYAQGWRRIIFNRATGNPSRAFHHMTPHQQAGYLGAVRGWAEAHPDCSLEAYISMASDQGIDTREADWTDPEFVCRVQRFFEPWLRSGFSTVWLDANTVGEHARAFIEQVNSSPNFFDTTFERRLTVGGEPMRDDHEPKGTPDDIDRFPYVTADQNGIFWPHNVGWDYHYDPRTTASNLWVYHQLEALPDDITTFNRLVEQGMILWYYWDLKRRNWWNRVYQFGTLEKPADFNGDGELSFSDMQLLVTRISLPVDGEPRFFDGDFNLDGRRDIDDVRDFEDAFNAGGGDPIDFGPSRWPLND